MRNPVFYPIAFFLLIFFAACGGDKPQSPQPTPQDSLAQRTVQLDFMGIRIGRPFHKAQWARQYAVRASIVTSPTRNDSTLAASFYDSSRNLRVSIHMLRDSSVYKVEAYLYGSLNDSLWNDVHVRYGDNAYRNNLYSNVFVVKHVWEYKNQRVSAYKNTTQGWEMMKFTYEDKALSERAKKGSRATTSTIAN